MTTPDPLSAAVDLREAPEAGQLDHAIAAYINKCGKPVHVSALSAAITAYIEATGCVLVPARPSPEMIHMGQCCAKRQVNGYSIPSDELFAIYRAMSPTIPQPPDKPWVKR